MNRKTESGDKSRAPRPLEDAVLVLMLKAPHRSKTRLVAGMGAAGVMAAHHLSACALEDAQAWEGPVCLAPADPADLEWTLQHRAAGWLVLPQATGNLGTRINHINQRLDDAGFDRQIFIGMDCPELDQACLQAAQAALTGHDAVLGAAADGGVVLMATRRRWPELATLPWSTPQLGEALAQRLIEGGWQIGWQEYEKVDVDGPAALQTMNERLAGDTRPARRALCAWLIELKQEYA
jgi:uncharacterized protein